MKLDKGASSQLQPRISRLGYHCPASSRSIGTPGLVRLLERAHAEQGRRPWAELFAPAIRLAEQGFPLSPRLAAVAKPLTRWLQLDAEASAYLLTPAGQVKAVGTILSNPAYARTLKELASAGPDAFYTGPLAHALVARAHASRGADGTPLTASKLADEDLARYRAIERPPVCAPYRAWWVCGMGPPSSGGLAVGQILGLLERFPLAQHPPAAGAEGGLQRVAVVAVDFELGARFDCPFDAHREIARARDLQRQERFRRGRDQRALGIAGAGGDDNAVWVHYQSSHVS